MNQEAAIKQLVNTLKEKSKDYPVSLSRGRNGSKNTIQRLKKKANYSDCGENRKLDAA